MEIPVDYGKPTLVHHHGSHYRTNGGPPGISSTIDLELAGAGPWIPSPIDLDSIESAPRKNAVLTIAHAPTNRALKSTEAFEDAVHRLEKRIPLRVLLIEGVANAECLRLKATADIYFDQTAYGYGVNGIEAMALGIPVVAGAQPDTLAEMERRFPIPFYTSTEDTLYYDLLDLVSSQVRRDYWGRMGLEHVRRFHDERVVVKQLEAIYRRLA
jgi:glycosyltransferase involved in cell wall biosynthesis